jgi:hypothetical protein
MYTKASLPYLVTVFDDGVLWYVMEWCAMARSSFNLPTRHERTRRFRFDVLT